MSNYIDDVFGPSGLMAQHNPKYEAREGQRTLAQAIADCFEQRANLMAEAPTGSGKGYAYLVPAIYDAAEQQRKTLIVTAGLALQEQLYKNDIPQLQGILPHKIEPVLIKGMQNYLCLERLNYVNSMGETVWPELTAAQREARDAILAWASIADTVEPYSGDKADAICAVEPIIWSKISTNSEDCLHQKCKHYKDCFVYKAREKAEKANLYITNYHMLFSDIAVRLATGGKVNILPTYNNLVMDEAHEAVDIARDFFGFSLSMAGIYRIAKSIATLDKSLSNRLKAAGKSFFDDIRKYVAKNSTKFAKEVRIKKPDFIPSTDISKALADCLKASAQYIADCGKDGSSSLGDVARAQMLTQTYKSRLNEALFQLNGNAVYWIEKSDDSYFIKSSLLDVSELLNEHLFSSKSRSVIMTSATLAVGNRFDFAFRETGFVGDTLTVKSPFDLYSRTMVVVPTEDGLPEPSAPNHIERSVELFKDTIQLCKGRTLGLFTSWNALKAVSTALQGTENYQILTQGEMPTQLLNSCFREDISSVLLGTKTYWTGIDVPGEALTCVVIHKLPFANFNDPVIDAMKEKLGERFFPDYYVPSAIMQFRQGVGRLIRSKNDYGIIVILDPRVIKKHRSFIVPGIGQRVSVGFTLKEIPPFLAKFE